MTGAIEQPGRSSNDAWPDDAVRDRIIGDWHIYQRKGGHRTSTDDVVTAWYAVHRHPARPLRYLDLGCGVGSVLLMVCHKLRPAEARGVEAQRQSVIMARRSIAELPPHDSAIEVREADFRTLDWAAERYDVITASPPYFPLGSGVLPDDPQRLACRFEARGGVEAYLAVAKAAMADGARLYLVFQTRGCDRVMAAAAEHELHLTGRADFLMRSDHDEPFLSVFELAQRPAAHIHRFRCAVRDHRGAIGAAYLDLRRELGVEASLVPSLPT